MTMTITTTMMMTTMPACNVFTQHTHRLSSTDGPRKGEQASITMTAPHALTNTYRGGEHHRAHPLQRRTACPCSWLSFFLWGAWGAGHVNYRPGAGRCSVAGMGGGPDP